MNQDKYPRPSLTADVVLFRFHGGRLELLLIERRHPPFDGAWALPGGFVNADEMPREGALRELLEETSVGGVPLVELGTFGAPGRDPRGWTVSAVYIGFAKPDCFAVAGDDAAKVEWHSVEALPSLAFDHKEIVCAARVRLRELTQSGTEPLRLLGETFRTRHARHLYSQILETPLKPTQFKAWLRRSDAVERVGPSRFKRRAHLRADWWR